MPREDPALGDVVRLAPATRKEAVMADASRYPLTTTPIKLGAVEIRNRFYLSPHGVGYNVGYVRFTPAPTWNPF